MTKTSETTRGVGTSDDALIDIGAASTETKGDSGDYKDGENSRRQQPTLIED